MVSVIMPSHNSGSTLETAVRSVLNQTYDNLELIIVDNGSIISPELSDDILSDGRVRLIEYAEILGAAEARNIGVSEAKGDLIAYLDSDDYWAPDKLEKQIKVMNRFRRNAKAPAIVFSGREIIDEEGNDTGHYIGCEKVVDYKLLLKSNQINCSSVMLKKDYALKYPFPDGDFHEDYAVWLSILREGGYAAGINRPLLFYRSSHSSKSGNKAKSAIMTYKVYRYIGLGVPASILQMFSYTIRGFKKHYFH